ncbi:MAG: hypothetical protein CMI32_08095 [Opitutales bacterium]|jgi:hypothetical protein|nr:hypothetical protein [Opitutales bacterium]
MIELALPLSDSVRAVAVLLLEDVLRELSGQDSFDEVRYAPPPADPDLHETWLEGLREDHASDLAAVRRLVAHADFGSETPVSIEPDQAEAALRGLTAVRLRIRENQLSDLPDSAMEGGGVEFDTLLPVQQQGYMAYAVAAATQERIICLLET